VARRGQAPGMKDGYLRGALSPQATQRQMDVRAAYVAGGVSVQDAAEPVGVRPSTAKRHLADLRARSGLTTEQLIYAGRAAGWLVVRDLEPEPRGRLPTDPGLPGEILEDLHLPPNLVAYGGRGERPQTSQHGRVTRRRENLLGRSGHMTDVKKTTKSTPSRARASGGKRGRHCHDHGARAWRRRRLPRHE
jgi:hypothetical protein